MGTRCAPVSGASGGSGEAAATSVGSMKAVRWHGRLDVRLEEIPPPPPPKPNEVQIEVLSCGICGTDIEEYRLGPLFIPASVPHPLTAKRAPVVLGHEVCGRVVAAGGPEGRELIGRLVAVDGLYACGRCEACRHHRVNLCEIFASIGFSADGGLAALMNAPAQGCRRLPEEVPPDVGVLAEPLAVGVRALRRARLRSGERVAVFGAGAVGLLTAQGALALGASSVTVIEPSPERRLLAQRLGLTTLETPVSDLDADVVVECSGAVAAVESAVPATRAMGRVVLVGITPAQPALDVLTMIRGEREVLGSLSHIYDEDFAQAVELIGTGALAMEGLVASSDQLEDALDYLKSPGPLPTGAVKFVIHPAARLNGDLEPH